MVRQLARYGTVGVGNTLVSAAVYALLRGLALASPAAAAAGFAAGAVHGYAWNRRWTFAVRGSLGSRLRYAVVQAVGLGATSALVWALTGAIGLRGAVAYAAAVALVTLSTFVANRKWTFAVL